MRRSRFQFLLLLFAIVAFASIALVHTSPGLGQSPSSRKAGTGTVFEQQVKPTASIRETGSRESAALSAHSAASQRNALLINELNWTFGGKQQRGWYLYVPLISQLLATNHHTSSTQFAAALARWQAKSGLTPSGVLDDDSLYSMISLWQGRRLKNRSYPPADQLVTVSASEFYDPSRPEELRQVHREAYAAYKRMLAAAIADSSLGLSSANGQLAPDEKFLKIISSFRSIEYQQKLRKQSPNAGRAGLAVNSPHFTGRALDLYVGGDPVETKDSNRAVQIRTPVYLWLVRNAELFGFRPYYYEPWHWEYVR
jgi:uncharacterized protein YcbK (DUF882 family)